jgi:hypothetical protein
MDIGSKKELRASSPSQPRRFTGVPAPPRHQHPPKMRDRRGLHGAPCPSGTVPTTPAPSALSPVLRLLHTLARCVSHCRCCVTNMPHHAVTEARPPTATLQPYPLRIHRQLRGVKRTTRSTNPNRRTYHCATVTPTPAAQLSLRLSIVGSTSGRTTRC